MKFIRRVLGWPVGLLLVPTLAPGVPAQSTLPPSAESAINRWTMRFTTSRRRDYEHALTLAQPWAPMVAAKLAAARLPGALVYLPLVESAYSPWAESSAHAAGLWQLMPATARGLGLEVSDELDERRDPWKATDAAIRHLQDLLRESRGDWLMTLARYNAGSGRVASRLLRVPHGGVPRRGAYWTVSPLLPTETREYVPQLLAAYRVGSAPSVYGIRVPAAPRYPPLARVSVPPRTPLAQIASVWNTTEDEIRAWNPALQQRRSPGRWYALVLPAERAEERQRALASTAMLTNSTPGGHVRGDR
ncbi:MAG: lytic transglycosylase domain-containing protein [Gemmatimonadaceae bacterium]|nr:lytic transglycosylase domain-containing protein [Gemmatimonadaceae bacterium]